MKKLTSSPTDKCFWSLAKKLSNNICNSTFPHLITSDGSIACSPTNKANLSSSKFSFISSFNDSNAPDPTNLPLCLFLSLCLLLSFQLVRFVGSPILSKLARPLNQMAYPRGSSENVLMSWLLHLILKSCTFPSAWKHALFQPVPKKGDLSNPSNYCPIALTSTIAMVFESLLNCHILKHLESNSLLSDHQYGFRKARSTGDLLSYLTHLWSSSFRNLGESYVVTFDISKPFDMV